MSMVTSSARGSRRGASNGPRGLLLSNAAYAFVVWVVGMGGGSSPSWLRTSPRNAFASSVIGGDSELECRLMAAAKSDRPFERVWKIVKSVPRGRVISYGEISRRIDGRLTPVGVGWAIRAAPEGSIPW